MVRKLSSSSGHFAYFLDILYCKVSRYSSANNELVAKTFRICKNFPVSIADALTGFLWLCRQATEYSATQLVKSIMFKVTQHTGLPTKTKPLNPKKYNSDMWKREGSAFLVWVTIFSLLLKGSERWSRRTSSKNNLTFNKHTPGSIRHKLQ